MVQWKIGCAGYHYAEWKGIFYPEGLPKNKWFDYYCEHFNAIELNTTFYRFPKAEFLRNLYNRSPQEFTFSVKAPRLITHFKKFKDAQRYLLDFYNAVRDGLAEKAGCVLFQFPSNFTFEAERLERIAALLDHSFINVVEFRHQSWWQEKVFQSLVQHEITFSGMSHPDLSDRVVRTTSTLYYRFHGVPHLYVSGYELSTFEAFAKEALKYENLKSVHVYFNNTAAGAAVANAKEFKEICEFVH